MMNNTVSIGSSVMVPEGIAPRLPSETVEEVQKAAEVLLAKSIARTAHRNQVYLPEHIEYFFHLDKVAQIVCLTYDGKFDLLDALVLSYLHDVVEDTDTQLDDLSIYFPERIIKGVSALTKDQSLPKRSQIEDSIHRIISEPKEVGIVKMADRAANLSNSLLSYSIAKKRYYAEEAEFLLEALGHLHKRTSRLLAGQINLFRNFHLTD